MIGGRIGSCCDDNISFGETGDNFDLGVIGKAKLDGLGDLLVVLEESDGGESSLIGNGGGGDNENVAFSVKNNAGGGGHIGEDLVRAGIKLDDDGIDGNVVGGGADAIDTDDLAGEGFVGNGI